MHFLYPSPKPEPLEEIHKNLEKAAYTQLERANLFPEIYSKMINFIHSEAIQFQKSMEESLSSLKEINQVEVQFAKMIERAKDDFQDIAERQKVILKLEEDQKQSLKELEMIKSKIQSAKYSLQIENSLVNQSQNEIYQSLLLEKSQILNKAKELTRKLIKQKKNFLKFTKNRLQHSIQTLGEAFSYIGNNETASFERIANKMSELRPQIDHLSYSISKDEISANPIQNPFEKI